MTDTGTVGMSDPFVWFVVLIFSLPGIWCVWWLYQMESARRWHKANPPIPKWAKTRNIKPVRLPLQARVPHTNTYLATPNGLEELYFESETEARAESIYTMPAKPSIWWPKPALREMENRDKTLDEDGRWHPL